MEIAVDSVVSKLIESSVSAALLGIVLAVFLPRLIRTIDNMGRTNTQDHEALIMIMLHLESRMNLHEAKVFGVNLSTGEDHDERTKAAIQSFNLIEDQLKHLCTVIEHIYDRRVHPR